MILQSPIVFPVISISSHNIKKMFETKVVDFNETDENDTFHIMHQFCVWRAILWEMDKV
jgi:hypothetical protein